jgi:hypothetical protein
MIVPKGNPDELGKQDMEKQEQTEMTLMQTRCGNAKEIRFT